MSGGELLGIAIVVVVVGVLLFMALRLVLMFLRNEELVSGGSWGKQLFGRRRDR